VFPFSLRFPGQVIDKETNTHYNTFRDYSPEIGRYIQSDPIGLKDGLNTYAYVYDNPVQLFDALGLDVRICFFPRAASGFGHVGIGIAGAPSTYGFYPRNQQAGLREIVKGTPGTVAEDTRDPNDIEGATCQILPATPDQDDCIERCIKSRASSPGTYRLLSRQCTSFSRDCLAECVLPSGDPNTPRPRAWYDSLPGGTQSPYIPTPDVTVPDGLAF
jgi:RHS repeat-associated protein